MVNILIINDRPFYPRIGGIERVTDVLAKNLINLYGFNVCYLAEEKPNVDTKGYVLPARLFSLPENASFDQKSFYIKQIIEEYKIDVVINQRGESKYFSQLVQGLETRVINVIHSQPTAYVRDALQSILLSPNSVSAYVKFFLKKIFYPVIYLRWRSIFISQLKEHYEFIINNSDAVVFLSDKYVNEVLCLLGRNNSRNTNILGIPNPNTFDSVIETQEKRNVILYVGRLSSRDKNPLRLLKVWRRLCKRYQEWEIKFVGDGDALAYMKEYTICNNLPRVTFCGNQENVLDYYLEASFICLTSNVECWGMALTEGMQCGCIPITFNSYAAASDIIDDGINGCLIRPFNLREYASRLSALMDNEFKRKKMAEAARKKVAEFDASKVAHKWKELIVRISDYDDNICY